MKFARSPKAHGWYYAEANGVAYVIEQSEFNWKVKADGVVVARPRTFRDAKAVAEQHAERVSA